MGLLDDAIREHLELKRRRGADAAEISRLEGEALAPVPRTEDGMPDLSDTVPEPSPASDPQPWAGQQTAAHPAPAPYEPPAAAPSLPPITPPAAYEDEPAWEPEPEPEPEPEEQPPPTSRLSRFNPARLLGDRQAPAQPPARATAVHKTPPLPPPAAYEPPSPPPAAYEPPPPTPYEPPSPAPVAYQPPPPPVPPPYTPPPAYAPAPPTAPGGEPPAGEDLLEETPEFLEETPEHDRLWFEQRPPRDFDFDG